MDFYIADAKDSLFTDGKPPIDTVEVVEYDNSWTETYEKVALSIKSELGSVTQRIDHVNFTAVPGLASKPWIDIDLSLHKQYYRRMYR